MKSKIEVHCRSVFQDFIESLFDPTSIRWEEVDQTNEPPDYYITINERKYAIEITTLMEHVRVGKQVIPSTTATFSLWGVADEVASIAEAEGYLRGAYYVIFSTPIDNFSHIKKSLQDNLLAYIKETQFLENAPELTVFEQGLQKCSIQKLHDQKNFVGKAGFSGAKWEGEIASEICKLLEERISTKQEKLREISYPKILLLYDAYHFSDYQMYQACLDRIPSLVSFHTLFFVPNDGPGILLYSECEEWLSP